MRLRGFTDEELSRILGEHAAGQLRRFGVYRWGYPIVCAVQAAVNDVSDADPGLGWAVSEFDGKYRTTMTPGQLLHLLRWPR